VQIAHEVSQAQNFSAFLQINRLIGVQEMETRLDCDTFVHCKCFWLYDKAAYYFMTLAEARWHFDVANEVDILAPHGQSLLEKDAAKSCLTFLTGHLTRLVNENISRFVEV